MSIYLKMAKEHKWKVASLATPWKDLSKYLPQKDKIEVFLEEIIRYMGIVFTMPEDKIVKQGEKSNSIYFIVQGDCVVTQ
jgi:CRP-like cAMP-binding protein